VSQPLLGPQFPALQQAQTPKTNFTARSKEQLQHDFICFWKFCDTWWISGGYPLDIMKKTLWGILKNKMLTGVGLPFSEMPHGILCSGSMPPNTLKNCEVFASSECCTWWNIPTKCESKWSSQNTDLKADPHTSDTKKDLGFLQVWSNSPDEHSYEMWEQWSSLKTDLKADPPKSDTGGSFNVYDLQSSVQVIFSSLFGSLSMSITSEVMCKLFSHPCLKTWNGRQ
jgi:hypothetical protein